MSKKIKITETKSKIKILPQVKKEESLEEVVEETSFPVSSSIQGAPSRTPTIRENIPLSIESQAQPIQDQQSRTTENTDRTTGYEVQTDAASREGYIFRPSERSFYENSRRQRTGQVSGQRAIPTIEATGNEQQGVRLQHNQTGLQNNSIVQVGDNDRQYIHYDDQSELKTKKRADWRL